MIKYTVCDEDGFLQSVFSFDPPEFRKHRNLSSCKIETSDINIAYHFCEFLYQENIKAGNTKKYEVREINGV